VLDHRVTDEISTRRLRIVKSASFWLYVNDSDALFNRAVAAGATVQMVVADQVWGDRAGSVADPAGSKPAISEI
jgi:PhnB protein